MMTAGSIGAFAPTRLREEQPVGQGEAHGLLPKKDSLPLLIACEINQKLDRVLQFGAGVRDLCWTRRVDGVRPIRGFHEINDKLTAGDGYGTHGSNY